MKLAKPVFFIDDTYLGKWGVNYMPIVGGFATTFDRYEKIRGNFLKLKAKYGLDEYDPIKWSPGQDDARYRKQKALKNINSLRNEVLKLISNSSLTIVSSIIDTSALSQTYKNHFYLNRSVDHLAKRFHYMIANKNLCKGVLLMDYPGKKESAPLASFYRDIFSKGASSSVKLNSLFDSLLYSHCYASDGLQLADFVVGCIGYTLKTSNYYYFDIIKDKIRSVRGIKKGCGLIVFPSNSRKVDSLCLR